MDIESFKVVQLYGELSFDIKINQNKLLLVAENGAGKTTLLRLIYLFLSKQWNRLIEYDFKQIDAKIDGKHYTFKKATESFSVIPEQIIKEAVTQFPIYRKFLEKELPKYKVEDLLRDNLLLTEIESRYDVPISIIFSILRQLSTYEFNSTQYDWKSNVLYLPTYRRIERDFDSLYGDVNKRLEVQIQQLIPRTYQSNEVDIGDDGMITDEMDNDFSRLFNTLWQARDIERWSKKENKDFHMELIEFGMDDVKYRISEILADLPKNEVAVNLYIEKCNKYLTNNKRLALSKTKRFIEIILLNSDHKLTFDTLSSGEKQILSLFSYLLAEQSTLFVIIDEPELSLSMTWQEMLLKDILDFKIDGLLVATHSPYIVANEFKDFTHGLNEFQC